VEANHNCGITLYAPSRDEEARVHKKQGHGTTCGGSVDKVSQIPHTNVISPTFEGQMVMMFGGCKANTILVLFIRYVPFSQYASCTCEWAL